MHLEWDIALWMLPVIVVAAASIGIGSKIRERYPRSRVGRVVGSTVFGIGLVGFGLGALAIIANLLAPIGVAAYCVVADCEAANAEARSFKCQRQPLPEFTLGEKSNPTTEQVEQLCQCIWDKLGSWEKRVATSLSKNENPTGPLPSPELNVRAFMPRFNEALTKCGGYDL
jgi:hypothetical protein